MKRFEVVFIQNNPLFDGDDNDDTDQHSMHEQLRKTTPDADEDEAIHEPTFQEFSE
jgi:hypothetical protein